jgi:hypothetical protein
VNGNDSLSLFQKIDTVISAQPYLGVHYDVDRYYDPQNPTVRLCHMA